MSENRWVSAVHWRREGQQTRSEKTQTALLDAAEILILENGTFATSIANVAELAGYSVGSVYHHFRDKKALFQALFHRMTDTYEDLTSTAADPTMWEGATVRDILQGYVEISLKIGREAGSAKAAVSVVVADNPELAKHYAEIQGKVRTAVLSLILARRDEIGHSDPDHAAAFVIDQLSAMLRARFDKMERVAEISDVDDTDFTTAVVEMVAPYLKLRAS